MTYSPGTYLDIRRVFMEHTALEPVELGIQHWSPEGGGYHEGNDLLAAGGRLDTDYSKRESDRDRPGTDGAAAIDIGWFDVTLHNGRRVTLIDLNRWLLSNVDAPDALWMREFIYTLDRRTVRRYDRLGKRDAGDDSHLTHTHVSGFRDEEATPKAPLFERFWREMEGQTDMLIGGDNHDRQLLFRVSALVRGEDSVTAPPGFSLAVPNEANWLVRSVKQLLARADGGGLTEEDRTLIRDLTTAVRDLNSRLATP